MPKKPYEPEAETPQLPAISEEAITRETTKTAADDVDGTVVYRFSQYSLGDEYAETRYNLSEEGKDFLRSHDFMYCRADKPDVMKAGYWVPFTAERHKHLFSNDDHDCPFGKNEKRPDLVCKGTNGTGHPELILCYRPKKATAAEDAAREKYSVSRLSTNAGSGLNEAAVTMASLAGGEAKVTSQTLKVTNADGGSRWGSLSK